MRLPVLLKRRMPSPEGVAPSHDTFTSVNVLPPPPVTEIPVGEPLAATRLKVELVTPTRFSPKPGTWLRSRSLSMSPPTSARDG